MSENKKYYWLKLKENFFEEKHIKYLRTLPDGDKLVIVYQKMQLKSLRTEGFIKYDQILPSNVEELAMILDEDTNAVRLAISALVKSGAVEILDDGSFYMLAMQDLIGKEGASAERVRKFRDRQKKLALPCNTDVTKCNTEIEIELEIEKDSINSGDKPPQKKPNYSKQYKEIIDYLNKRLGTQYKYKSTQTQKLIKGRLEEGFTVADFKTVIDKKYLEWYKDEKMRQYLRPVTLFGTKFEGYLNQDIKVEEEKPKQKVEIVYDNELGQFIEKAVDGE